MLTITDLSVNYGPVQALSHVSLDVPRGEVTAVIGANGAGKSTLMRTLAGLVKPDSGSAQLDGHAHHRPQGRRTSCGWAWPSCPKAARRFPS